MSKDVLIKRYNGSSWDEIYPKTKASLVIYGSSNVGSALDGKQGSVAKLGSTTKPVYTSAAGTFAECSVYAGGTAVTLNNTDKGASTASFYAPTGAGTAGQYLASGGSGTAPSWASKGSIADNNTGLVDGGTVKAAIDAAISSVYKPAGSIAPSGILSTSGAALLVAANLGKVYNVTDTFTSDSNFVEYQVSGVGTAYPSGTNVVIVNYGTSSSPSYKFDILSGFIDLTSYATTSYVSTNYEAKFTDGSATIASVNSDVVTIKAGVAQSSGAISNSTGTDITLAKVAKTGSWSDLSNKPASKGGTTQPVYIDANGAFQNTTYTLGKSVPSDAVFTDTTYTAGVGLSLSSSKFSVSIPCGNSAPSSPVTGSICFIDLAA